MEIDDFQWIGGGLFDLSLCRFCFFVFATENTCHNSSLCVAMVEIVVSFLSLTFQKVLVEPFLSTLWKD